MPRIGSCAEAAAIAGGNDGVRLVGTYVEAPLTWAVSAGAASRHTSVASLQYGAIGISRIGSGSHVMAVVMAEQAGWLPPAAGAAAEAPSSSSNNRSSSSSSDDNAGDAAVSRLPGVPLAFVTLNDFRGLRDGVNSGRADAFLWETFTTKVRLSRPRLPGNALAAADRPPHGPLSPPVLPTRTQPYHDSKELRRIGEIRAPWAAFMVAARADLLDMDAKAVQRLLAAVNVATARFSAGTATGASQAYVAKTFGQQPADVEAWFRTVRYPADAHVVSRPMLQTCLDSLRRARLVPDAVDIASLVDARVAIVTDLDISAA